MRAIPDNKQDSAKGRARKDRILEVATKLVARNGARGTTLSQIAEAAGISQAGLLYHYPTKEALLNAVLDRRDAADQHLRWNDQEEPGLDVVSIMAAAVRGWHKQADMVGMTSILVAENAPADAPLHARLVDGYSRTIDRLCEALKIGQRRGEIRSEIEPRLKAIEMVAFLHGLESAWLVNPSLPVAETAAQWAESQVRALRANQGAT